MADNYTSDAIARLDALGTQDHTSEREQSLRVACRRAMAPLTHAMQEMVDKGKTTAVATFLAEQPEMASRSAEPPQKHIADIIHFSGNRYSNQSSVHNAVNTFENARIEECVEAGGPAATPPVKPGNASPKIS